MRVAASTLALLAFLLSVPLPVAAQPPNIVVVLVDDLRWDEVGAAGHPS